MTTDLRIQLAEVSKFYGEVLGVNRISMVIGPGITSLVGPNGAGKTTLLNLITGLVRPTQGEITIGGVAIGDAEAVFRLVGYCTQYDAFPHGLSGIELVRGVLTVHGMTTRTAHELACEALSTVGLLDAADKKIAAYSKGMRQRVKLAQALAHRPRVLILDEPLNGLDPMARAEVIALLRRMATEGKIVLVSSHILHEVDVISDSVILMNHGYVVAEGGIHDVRGEVEEHPFEVLVRCDRPALLASRVFALDHTVEARIHADGRGLVVATRDPAALYRLVNRLAVDDGLVIETVQPADDDVQSLYDYLIGHEGGRS
ncbi:MAG TPA: ABC transporter ATP-binding protein [Thermoanaerobaculaceae bacterium]|nr:ABC transporter ATP-binding protein [Thermoanaerobaculaceae bacterium]HPS76614.1 ABC transporter ATP-binding protein [Thermoanaerobaculaceae bacterium]